MKRRLKQPIELLLQKTSVPEPDFSAQRDAHMQVFQAAVRRRTEQPRRGRGQGSLWHFGRSAVTFASIGLFVLIGIGTVLAQAGRAQPGHPLYRLNRALESTQLALAQDEADKLELKVNFVEERLSETVKVGTADTELVVAVVSDAVTAVREVDGQFDQARLALASSEPAELEHQQLDELSGVFRQILSRYENEIQTLAETTNSESARVLLSDISDLLIAERAGALLGDVFYVELDGQLSANGLVFRVNERDLSVSGPLAGATNPLVGGQAAKVRLVGRLSGSKLTPDYIRQQPYTLKADSSGQAVLQAANAVLQRDEAGLFVENGSKRFYLSGELAADQRLVGLVGQPVTIGGRWRGGSELLLSTVTGEVDGETIQLPAPEPAEPAEPSEGNALPATDESTQPDTPPPGFNE